MLTPYGVATSPAEPEGTIELSLEYDDGVTCLMANGTEIGFLDDDGLHLADIVEDVHDGTLPSSILSEEGTYRESFSKLVCKGGDLC